MKKIKVGLIGYGYWGPNIARILNDSKKTELLYCADLLDNSLTHVKQNYPKVLITKDYKEILRNKQIDAIFVTTPTKTHYQIAKDCLTAKKHVFIEKPLTNNEKDAEELIKLAKKNNKKLAVGHIFLFNPSVKYIKKIIEEKKLGTIRYLHFQRRNLGPVRKDVNVLWDLAPHDISMLLYFIKQKPISVLAAGQSFLRDNIEDVVYANIKFENKIMANLIYSWIDPIKIRDITIVGDKKMLLFNDVSVSEKIKIFDKNAKIIEETQGVPYGEYQIALHAGGVYTPSIENKEPLKEEIDHFIDSIIKNKQPVNDGLNGLRVVEIITAMQKSLDKRATEYLK
jgi:predicted dehydrogenase